MNQKTCTMIISGIVAAVTSIVFTGSAMSLIGIKKSAGITLDPMVAGQQPTPPAKKTDNEEDTKEVETNL